MRKLAVLIGTLAATVLFLIPAAAGAGPTAVFDGAVSCAVKSGQTRCGTGGFKHTDGRRSTVKSFDGVPIDVNVAFPKPADSPWGEGPYPLVMVFHGYSQGKMDFTKAWMQMLLARGYAVFSQTNRGFHESCGTVGAQAADPVCDERGYVRLDDTRYEVRDAQYFAGMLVDEGLVRPDRLAAIGSSYGGGMSMALAALKDRVMLPDSSYAPWESRQGTPMSLAVAVPDITWSDLAYSLFPNGSTLDYLADSPYSGPFGVMKESLMNGLFFSGLLAPGYYAEIDTDPTADLYGWRNALDAGEPYEDHPEVEATLTELTAHHSSYYIDHSQPPAPLLISAGFTDDLFPASETLRFYNRSRSEYPTTPMGLFLGPIGGGASHPRGQNKAGVNDAQTQMILTWLDHYLADVGEPPASDVTAFTQTCPDSAAAAGPFVTGDWVSQAPGEIQHRSEATQTVSPEGGTVAVSTAFRPGDGVMPCVQVDGAAEPGTANYEVDPAPAGGYTLMGSPTVIADIEAPGGNSALAARLVDVSPNGQKKLLVARALWRPATSGLQVFQLNPNGWKVKKDHGLRLELLPHEQGEGASQPFFNNYGRVSDDQRPVTVSELELRIPVRENPGSLDGVVTEPATRVLPDRTGVSLARGNEEIGGVPIEVEAGASVFDDTVTCETQGSGSAEGQVWCGTGNYRQTTDTRSTVKSFDDVPIDVNAAFPDPTGFGNGPYPLVYMFHGYGNGKIDFPGMSKWLNRGYAVFSQTNRGFHESCGTATSKASDPVCQTEGFVRLDDTRYEVRDAQLFAGMLVDEGLVQPTKIAAVGDSYGGGMSMALAALKDRVMLPDSSYAPWKSPDGTPMSLAVAVPNITWTDLAYSLVPNGSNIDYIEDASYHGRFGVMKQSYVNGLYLSGAGAPGYYTPAGEQPSADLAGWHDFMTGGEPYDGRPEAQAMLNELKQHHSSYYIDHSQAPAPLLISSGFTDDLFPANEATRFYNRTVAEHPNADIGLFFGSFGHDRGQNRPWVTGPRSSLEKRWIEYYLSGTGSKPASDVTTYTQTCPKAKPDGGPYVTTDWAAQSPGEIRIIDGDAQTVLPDGGDRAVGTAFNPISPGEACAEATGVKEPGTANYELNPAPAGGYTVMGSPTVIAKIKQAGSNSQISARLVDVAPDGSTKTLVNRETWRPAATEDVQVFQLNPNGWHVDEGHVLRLELLPFDGSDNSGFSEFGNYSRPSFDQQPATITDLDLRVPVLDAPGAQDGLITKPAPKVLPDRPGVELASGYDAIGSQTIAEYSVDDPKPDDPEPLGQPVRVAKVKVRGKLLLAKFRCPAAFSKCARSRVVFQGVPRRGPGRGVILARRTFAMKAGQTAAVRFRLTAKARRLFRDRRVRVRRRGRVRIKRVRGLKNLRTRVVIRSRSEGSAGLVMVRRTGRVR